MDTTKILYIAFIVLGVFFISLAIIQLLKAKKAEKSWPTAPGVIMSSVVGTHLARSSRGGTTTQFMPEVAYEYQVNEITYKGSGVGFGKSTTSSRKATEIVSRYPQGTAVTVHYDPQDPAKAVLETKAYSFGSYLTLGIIFAGMGVVLAFILK
jgi:hypothetical protein